MGGTDNISIVIPVYNEADNIDRIIREARSITKDLPEFEIVVVDDNSTDGTPELAELQGVDVVRHSKNMGYGHAVQTGIRHARGDTIVILDGDGRYNPESIPALLAPIRDGSADFVIGSSLRETSQRPLANRIGNTIFNSILKWVFRIDVPDWTSSLVAMRRETANKMASQSEAFPPVPVYALVAAKLGFRVAQVPTTPRTRFEVYPPPRDRANIIGRLRTVISSRWSAQPPS